ncbi:hypothetical protein [Candidatus Viadribacter manganicus]|uniref:TIR domain-containing protein n=1 Tax=Candidatus Viadribacter manganicus TaxID=1759059 RepID=A0A1B1AKY9_9PROT|nr:hypothetical protein [Candidatus Viadribacter manganicus]ANP47217.1 hypothetical protein ATE48_15465 [Candidatus Viadribacter manganicus]
MPTPIFLAHPRGAENHARGVAAELKALGYEVRSYTPQAQRAGAHKVVLLWSRAAWGTPALRAAARKAHATGSLVCVRLDAAPPPVEGAHLLPLKRNGSQRTAWRRALSSSPRATPARTSAPPATRSTKRARRTGAAPKPVVEKKMQVKEKNSRLFAIALTITLLAATGAGYAYGRYPAFAAPIDQAASAAYTKASEIAALAP